MEKTMETVARIQKFLDSKSEIYHLYNDKVKGGRSIKVKYLESAILKKLKDKFGGEIYNCKVYYSGKYVSFGQGWKKIIRTSKSK